jgi:hypothetical protein
MDIEAPWQQDMGRDSWDLIHLRTLNGSIQNYPRLYSQIFRCSSMLDTENLNASSR